MRWVEHTQWIPGCVFFFVFWVRVDARGFPPAWKTRGSNTQITLSQNVNASNPSNLKRASNENTSASVLLCDTAVCVLHANDMGTHV